MATEQHPTPIIPADVEPTPRFRKGNGGSQSPLFTKLNYDIRAMIYKYLPPVLTTDDTWRGFLLSCRQAYEELSEAAPVHVKKFLDHHLAEAERKTNIKYTLPNGIDMDGGIPELRYIDIALPFESIDNPDQEWYYDEQDMNNSYGDEIPIDEPLFTEDKAIIALGPIFTAFFFHVAIHLTETDEYAAAQQADYQDTMRDMDGYSDEMIEAMLVENMEMEREYARLRMLHVEETLHMICANPGTFHSVLAHPNPRDTPRTRIARLRLGKINVGRIDVVWDRVIPELDGILDGKDDMLRLIVRRTLALPWDFGCTPGFSSYY